MSTEDIPDGWAWARLDDLAAPGVGAITDGPFGSNLKTEHYTEVGPRVVRLQNIGNGVFVDARAHISGDRFVRLRRHEVVAGDLVLAMLGESLPRTCLIPQALGQAIVKADCARVRLDERLIDAKFVNLFLNSEPARRRTSKTIHGVGRPRIGLEGVKSLLVPVAPRPEQHRIVAELEQQLSRIDAGVAALERAKANLERYRASVLKAACEGRLVPTEAELARAEGRSFEPAGELLARILKERRARWEADQLARMKARGKPPKDDAWKKKYPEPAAPDTSKLPQLPEGWCWATLDQLASRITKGTTPTSLGFAFTESGTRFVKVESLANGRVRHELCAFIASDANEALERSQLAADDILLSIAGTLGRVAIVHDSDLPANTNQALAIVRLVDPLVSEYLNLALSAPRTMAEVEAVARGVGLRNLNLEQVASLSVPLPPKPEQHRILAEVDRLATQVEFGSIEMANTLLRASRLRQSLLAHAFSGKLVPQDPNDEPASVLLERIRKEREAQAVAGKEKKASPGRRKRAPAARSKAATTSGRPAKKRKRRDRP